MREWEETQTLLWQMKKENIAEGGLMTAEREERRAVEKMKNDQLTTISP